MHIKINGWKMYYEEKGEGETVLLLHGIPTSSYIWRAQIEALSKKYRVFAVDLLGWGLSDKPADFDYKIGSYVEIIDKFVESAGIKKMILIVHDLGGAVGLTFFAYHPEKISRLVILNTFAYMPLSKSLSWKMLYGFLYKLPFLGQLLNKLVWYLTVKKTDIFVTLAFYNKKLVTKELVKKYRELNRDTRLTDYRILMVNGIDGVTSAVEKNSLKVSIPTLILWAENDMLFPLSAAKKLHENIIGSVIKTIPECGHFLQEEKPDETNKHILDFLRQ